MTRVHATTTLYDAVTVTNVQNVYKDSEHIHMYEMQRFRPRLKQAACGKPKCHHMYSIQSPSRNHGSVPKSKNNNADVQM